MKLKLSNETKVGILATFALVIVIFGINFMRGNNVFSTDATYYAKFHDVNGLSASNAVMLFGVKVGQVDKLTLINEGSNRVEVKIHVNRDIKIPANSIAKINSDLLGSKTLEIIPGNASTLAKSHDTLIGAVEPSLPEALSKTVSPIKDKVEALVSSIDTVVTSLNDVFNDKTKRDLKGSFAAIKPTIENIESATAGVKDLVGTEAARLHDIIGNLDKLSKDFTNYNAPISRAIDNFASISDTLRAMNLKSTVTEASKTVKSLDQIMVQIQSGQGTLGKLIADDKLYYSLVSATRDMDKLVSDIKANPHKYFSPLGQRGKSVPLKQDTAR